MALAFFTGFDAYDTAGALLLWDAAGGGGPFTVGAFGRNSTQGIQMSRNNVFGTKILTAQATWTLGVAVNPTTLASTSGVFSLLDGATQHISVIISTLGKIEIRRASMTGTLLATSTATVPISQFTYIECKVLISDTVGTIDLQVNGSVDTLTFASGSNGNQDTRNGGNATADRVRLGDNTGTNAVMDTRFDDFYACDGTGGSPTNTFLGDVRAQNIMPNGNGNSSQFVGSDGNSTDNYLLVDEIPANGDTDYVESATVNDKDTYAYGDLTATAGTVYGVMPIPYARKSDAGTRKIVSVARLSGTEVDSADKTLLTNYAYYFDVRETKPGGGAWSVSDVNSAEFGMKVSA